MPQIHCIHLHGVVYRMYKCRYLSSYMYIHVQCIKYTCMCIYRRNREQQHWPKRQWLLLSTYTCTCSNSLLQLIGCICSCTCMYIHVKCIQVLTFEELSMAQQCTCNYTRKDAENEDILLNVHTCVHGIYMYLYITSCMYCMLCVSFVHL